MVALIFLNIFIAIILDGYEMTNKRLNMLVSERDLEKFVDCWAKIDKKVRKKHFIKFIQIIGHWLYQIIRSSSSPV